MHSKDMNCLGQPTGLIGKGILDMTQQKLTKVEVA
jgi:hypothetical protein